MSTETVTRAQFEAAMRNLMTHITETIAKLPAPRDTITTAEIMDELGLKTRFGMTKWCSRYHLHPITRGVYRMDDYRAAKARAALRDGHNMVRRTRAKRPSAEFSEAEKQGVAE